MVASTSQPRPPHSTPVAIGLMRALAAAGDIADALLHARAHIALVQSEFELPPDPEVLELTSQLQHAAESLRDHPLEDVSAEIVIGDAAQEQPEASPDLGQPPAEHPRFLARRGDVLLTGLASLAALVFWGLYAVGSAGKPTSGSSVVVMGFAESDGSGPVPPLGEALAARVASTLSFVPDLSVHVEEATRSAAGSASAPGGAAVVQGTLRRARNRWQVTARLSRGREEQAHWTATWERPADSDAVLLDELSLTIAGALRQQVARYEPKVYTESRRAYDRFLQGVYAHRRFTHEDIWAALQFYREAWEEDPGFALARAVAGNAYIDLTLLGLSPEIGLARAREHIDQALSLDSTLAEGHAALGYVQIWGELDFEAGERSLRRAIMLSHAAPGLGLVWLVSALRS